MSVALTWVLVFLAVALSDVFWTLCVRRVQHTQVFAAGSWGLLFFLTQAYGTISFVDNKILLIPAAFGAFAGTAMTVWWEKRREKAKNEYKKSAE